LDLVTASHEITELHVHTGTWTRTVSRVSSGHGIMAVVWPTATWCLLF